MRNNSDQWYYFSSEMDAQLRKIEPSDDRLLCKVIKSVMEEMDYAIDGTVYTDPNTEVMSSCYQTAGTAYWIVELNGELLGGSGIGKIEGADPKICELQRMFLTSSARGKGIGQALMNHCIGFAREAEYSHIYLETLPNMPAARKLYERSGFKYIDYQIGETGHFSCDVYMLLEL